MRLFSTSCILTLVVACSSSSSHGGGEDGRAEGSAARNPDASPIEAGHGEDARGRDAHVAKADAFTSDSGGTDGAKTVDASRGDSHPAIDAQQDAKTSPDAGDGGKAKADAGPLLPVLPPQVVAASNDVLSAPIFVPVFFSNEDPTFQASLEDFTSKVGASAYWTATTSEYMVGAATSAMPVSITPAPAMTVDDSTIQSWLAQEIAANALPLPTADTVYVLYYPTGTTITLSLNGANLTSCADFGGYHSEAAYNQTHIVYAVIPRCGNLAAVTGAASHELIEASTDPHPFTGPAYDQVDEADFEWQLAVGGGEVADMCAQFPGVLTQFASLPYTVQRSWSNLAITMGHDPCVPALPGEVYFQSQPQVSELVQAGANQIRGVKIPVGQTGHVPLALYSDGATSGPWSVSVKDLSVINGGPTTMTFTLSSSTGNAGDVLDLAIQVVAASQNNLGTYIVASELGQQTNLWVGAVGN